jgi:hypothetical protein
MDGFFSLSNLSYSFFSQESELPNSRQLVAESVTLASQCAFSAYSASELCTGCLPPYCKATPSLLLPKEQHTAIYRCEEFADNSSTYLSPLQSADCGSSVTQAAEASCTKYQYGDVKFKSCVGDSTV